MSCLGLQNKFTAGVPAFLVIVIVFCLPVLAYSGAPISPASALPVWAWAVLLFVFCCAIGVVAIIAGVGGGVLFVPLAGAFFPFHMDFIRGAALFVALAGALSASSRFLRQGLTFPRLVLPLSVASSIGAIFGAMAGLAMPENTIRILLGITILGICAVMVLVKRADMPQPSGDDPIARALNIEGCYFEKTTNQQVIWRPQRMPLAIALFAGIGFLAGMFGLGAGWANVPVLNLVMGVPLKAAVAGSLLIISIADTPPALIYLNSGAILAVITVPCVAGMMLGSTIGSRLVTRTRPKVVRIFVLTLLAVAGILSLLKGLRVL